MKRIRLIKDFLLCMRDNDVAIFSGRDLSREAFQYDSDRNFYVLDDSGVTISLALGVAMSTDKRVFVFSGDGNFLYNIGSYAQTAVSKCKNIFNVILDNGCYQAAGGHPTIFRELSAPKGIVFSMGFLTYDFTSFFNRRIPVKEVTKTIDNLVGPAFILIDVDKGYKKGMKDIDVSEVELRDRTTNFIKNEELGTSLYEQQFFV